MADAPVLVERRELVALVTLNRPEKHNALSLDLLGRLQAVVHDLGEDAAVRVVIVRGNDRCFSTGMDLDDLRLAGSRLYHRPGAERERRRRPGGMREARQG